MDQGFEVVIVGMGPAGLAAATVLAECGARVAVIDEGAAPGGQVYRQPPEEFRYKHRRDLGLRYRIGQELIRRFQALSHRMALFHETLIWAVSDGRTLYCLREGRMERIAFEKLLICEGAHERAVPFPGWTLPGVMTAGGLQRLLSQQGLLPGTRFLLTGTGPLQISVAAKLLKAGAQIVGLCEASSARGGWRLLAELFRQGTLLRESASSILPVLLRGVPVYLKHRVIEASGHSRVQEAVIARMDRHWRPIAGTEKHLQVDVLGCGFGFVPASRLTRVCGCAHRFDTSPRAWVPVTASSMRSSLESVYVAGDSAGIGGATMADIEGRIAACHIASELGRLSDTEAGRRVRGLLRQRQRVQRYVSLLDGIFQPQGGIFDGLDEDTVLCRCEQVRVRDILGELEQGCRDLNEMKRRTRAGMGLCQGRTCEWSMAELMRRRGVPMEEIGQLHIRPPLAPIPFSALGAG